MIHLLRLLLAAILGAIGRRWAGGGFTELTGRNPGDYPTRLFWGLTCATAVHGPWWLYAAIPAGVFVGCAAPIHFRSIGITLGARFYGAQIPPRWQLGGTLNRGWREVAGLTLHGLGNMALPPNYILDKAGRPA